MLRILWWCGSGWGGSDPFCQVLLERHAVLQAVLGRPRLIDVDDALFIYAECADSCLIEFQRGSADLEFRDRTILGFRTTVLQLENVAVFSAAREA